MVATFSGISTAGAATKYFEKDNYYTKDGGYGDSQWMGKGSAALGLSGNIKPDDFKAILEGKVGGQELGKWGINEETGEKEWQHRPGLDVTLSAPKTVSLLRQLGHDERITAALYESAEATLAAIEKEYSFSRVTEKGVTRAELTGNLIAAVFHHDLARVASPGATPDPDDHMHLVLANATQCTDDKWRSLDFAPLRQDIKTIGAIFHADLRERFEKQLGYDTETTGINGEWEVKGITRDQVEHFSQRAQKIEERLEDQGLTRATASSNQKQVANLETRHAKERVDRDQVGQANEVRAEAIGLDARSLVEAAKAAVQERQATLDPQPPKTAAEIASDSVSWAIDSLQERSFVNSRSEIIQHALGYAQGKATYEDVAKDLTEREQRRNLLRTHAEQEKEQGRITYTTPQALKLERDMVRRISAGLGAVVPIANQQSSEKELKAWQQEKKITLNPGQHDAAMAVSTSADRYHVIQGSAGVGKTTLVNGIKAVADQHGVLMRGLAQGGSQARTLQSETGIESSTIASFVARTRVMEGEDLRGKFGGEVWIVDEASQASQKDVTTLVRLADVSGSRIVFVGDREQLLSIESGTAMALAMDGSKIQVTKIEEIVRQREEVDRQMVAQAAKGEVAKAIEERIAVNKDLVGAAAKLYLDRVSDQDNQERNVVLTGLNIDRRQINDEIRSKLQASGQIEQTGQQGSALIRTDLTQAETRDARSWIKLDQKITEEKRDVELVVQIQKQYQHLPTEAGEVLKVDRIDPASNVLHTVRENGEKVAIDLSRTAKVEALYREGRQWSVGDMVRFTQNDREAGIANGDVGRIVAHGPDGTIQIDSGGKTVDREIRNARMDHGYAATVHASQGWSKENVIWAARTSHGEAVLDSRTGYVAVSRAKGQTSIVTDDKVKLQEALGVRRQNESAMAARGEVKLSTLIKDLDQLDAKRQAQAEVVKQQQDQQQNRGLER